MLILRKKTQAEKDAEEKSGMMAPYKIFMAMVERVGHDKRGNPLFKRDKEGNEILVDGADGRKNKVSDDQTTEIPALFKSWMKEEGLSW